MKATWIDTHFNNLINTKKEVTITSIYNNVINFIYENTYYSITNEQIPKANYFLQVDGITNYKELCEVGETLTITNNTIYGNRLNIDLTSITLYTKEPLKFTYSEISISYLDSLIKKEKIKSGPIDFYRNKYFGIYEESNPIDDYLKTEIKKLNLHLLKDESHENIKIVGTGLGSTPSGDDYLCGFLYCCNHIFDMNDIKKEIVKLINYSKHKTTDISNLMYQIYLNGGSHEIYYNLLKAISDSSLFSLNIIYKKIKKIGHSSGIDFLIGIMNALKIYKERK